MKRVLLMALVLVLLIVLVGCYDAQGNPIDINGNPVIPKPIQALITTANISMPVWLGTFGQPPSNPTLNSIYRESSDNSVYLWDGNSWSLMTRDGVQGPAGPQGIKGDTGSIGPQGSQGAIGPQGEPGVKGDTGSVGAAGPQGLQGYQGLTGLTGETGPKGDTGAQGIQGYQGSPGVKGDTGAQGTQGLKGDTGNVGPQGEPGVKGDTGLTGSQGPKGDTGDVGLTGPPGEQGIQGEKGDKGAEGEAGVPGSDATVTFSSVVGALGYTPTQGSITASNVTEALGFNPGTSNVSTKGDVGLGNVPNLDTTNAVNNQHIHSNGTTLDSIQEALTTALKSSYDWLVTNITAAWKTSVDNLITAVANIGSSNVTAWLGYTPMQGPLVATNITTSLGYTPMQGPLVSGNITTALEFTPMQGPLVANNITTALGYTPATSTNATCTIEKTDEFLGGLLTTGNVGELGWSFLTTAPTYAASVANHPGVRVLTTSGTINTVNAFYLGSASTNDIIQFGDQCDFTFVVAVPTITTVMIFVGAMDNATNNVSSGQDCYGFKFNPAVSANWTMITSNGSTMTTTNTTTAVVAGTYYTLRVVRTGSGVDYYINGVNKGTNTTNLPDTALTFGFQVQTLAASARTMNCDFFGMGLTVVR